jgi:hypothetical protein
VPKTKSKKNDAMCVVFLSKPNLHHYFLPVAAGAAVFSSALSACFFIAFSACGAGAIAAAAGVVVFTSAVVVAFTVVGTLAALDAAGVVIAFVVPLAEVLADALAATALAAFNADEALAAEAAVEAAGALAALATATGAEVFVGVADAAVV